MKKIAIVAILSILLLPSKDVLAWADSQEALNHLGFSPETIRVFNLQKTRMEDGPDYKVERTRYEQFRWNTIHNDPFALTFPFGEQLIKY